MVQKFPKCAEEISPSLTTQLRGNHAKNETNFNSNDCASG